MDSFGTLPNMFELAHMARMQLQWYKDQAEKNLRNGSLSEAIKFYNGALTHCSMNTPILQDEVPKILNNRSLVFSKMGNFDSALADAEQCMQILPFWAKGYWRAATAFKGLNLFYEALGVLIQGYNITLPQHDQNTTTRFLVELILTITGLRRMQGGYDRLLEEHQELHPGSTEVQQLVLQQLTNQKCWEGVSLLVTGKHVGPCSSLDFSAPNCPATKLSVGSLLLDLSTKDLKRYGMDLALALLKNGAPIEEIERKWEMPVLHVVSIKTLETGVDALVKFLFRKYLDTQEKKDAIDQRGRSVLHIIASFRSCGEDERNALLLLCLNNGCSSFVFDNTENLPIDYCEPEDKCFNSLRGKFKDTEIVKKHIADIKDKGNAANKEKRYDFALILYTKAIKLSTICGELQRDSAVLYTNRCTVYSELDRHTEALDDAESAIQVDKTWLKGHWRKSQQLRRTGQHSKAIETAVMGQNIPGFSLQDKCELLTEGSKSLQYMSDIEKTEQYEVLQTVPNDTWTNVLHRLSKQAEWICLKELIWGPGEGDEAIGIAKDADFSTISFSCLFPFLIKQTISDMKAVGSWLVPLIVHIIKSKGRESMLRFKEAENDTPLHAAARLSVVTGNAALLTCIAEEAKTMDQLDGNGNSPLHSIINMPRPPQFDTLPQVVEMLLEMGVSAELRDSRGKLAVDCVDQSKDPKVFELLNKRREENKTPGNDKGKHTEDKLSNDIKIQENATDLEKRNKSTDQEFKPNTKCSNSMAQNEAKEDKPGSSKAEVQVAASKDDFKHFQREGDRLFKEGRFKSALVSLENAKKHTKQAKQIELMHLFCKIADCYLQFGQYNNILEEMKKFPTVTEKSYQAQIRIGKAYAGLDQHKNALSRFKLACQLSRGSSQITYGDILYEIAISHSKCRELENSSVRNIKGFIKHDWIKTIYRLIQNNEWIAAEHVFMGLSNWSERYANSFDLKILCNINKVQDHEWVVPFILELLINGSDYHSLYMEKGESFLHATVRLTLVTGILDLFQYVIQRAVRNNEHNIQDAHGNSVLHLAVDKRTTCIDNEFQYAVLQELLIAGVNPLLLNRQKKLASKCAPRSLPHLADVLRKYETAKKAEIGKQKWEHQQREQLLRQQREKAKSKAHEQIKIRREEERNNDECATKCKGSLDKAKTDMSSNIRLACYSLVKIFHATKHKSDMHRQLETDAIHLIIDAFGLQENLDIPEKLTRVHRKIYCKIIHGLAEKEHWKQMHMAVVEFRRHHEASDLRDFASRLSVEHVLNCKNLQKSEHLLKEIVENMLQSGAVLHSDGKDAVEIAVQNNYFKVLERLFDFNANPEYLSVEDGDTPIHAALYIALYRDKGNMSLLKKFLDKYEKEPDRFPMLNPMKVNLFGESLFHVVAKAKNSLEVTVLLCEKGVKSNIRDREGKLPTEYLKSDKDERMQYFRLASRKSKLDGIDISEEHTNNEVEKERKKRNTPIKQSNDAPLKKQKLKEEILNMIKDLTEKDVYSEELMRKSRKRKDVNADTTEKSSGGDIQKEPPYVLKIQNTDEAISGLETDFQIEPGCFESHEWEIECTHDVWKRLMSSSLTENQKVDIIRKLQSLVAGDLSNRVCLKLELVTQNATVEIYESGPLLWEIAICFSPKLTDAGSKGVYSEVIRVWDIVRNQDEKDKALKKITESCLRGEECLVDRYVACSSKLDQTLAKGKRIPRKYFQCSPSEFQEDVAKVVKLILPASHLVNEYHILKFFTFTTDMAICALQNKICSGDFPFKVTEVEQKVINLSSTAPVLLLGRSGTGKTSCCIYRLWSRYDCHRRHAIEMKENLNVEDGDEDEEVLENMNDDIRQLFITKNLVLCNEVQKTFAEMRNSSAIGLQNVLNEVQPMPSSLQDLQNSQFPLFTTSRNLLLMIDASLPNPFFRRDVTGKILENVPGWTNEDDTLSFLPKLDDDSETESDNETDGEYEEDDINDDEKAIKRKSGVRREVTYDIFAQVVWPKIKKDIDHYHPSLIWMEIMSFIKGSYEAVLQKHGYLSKEEYISHGRKKAPNFAGERDRIYEIFLRYKHYLKQHFLFDETDVVRDIFNRLQETERDGWGIQEIYVDETQDFTQAELHLLISICQNPNGMFLTGDTAQGIMRGISFRFKDLRSLFHHARESRTDIQDIKLPDKIYQLTHNYRSHSGILSLASGILDILVEYFPDSFDVLQKDKGLFQGPAPILLEIQDSGDLGVLLKGKKKSASGIDFGAHQAVLVVNDESRESLPEELQQGIVLTIYESKGLEFDDILLYNFFKDSQAGKEWRVVTEFLEKFRSKENDATTMNETDFLDAIDYSVFEKEGRPRPLKFEPNQHKVLNTELKQLYTAVTRARVHVWIFDESEARRAPMFEYFKARKLVQSIEESESGDDLMFAEESTTEDWLHRGEEFMKKSLYNVAAKCFRQAGDFQMEKIAKSHQKALLASRMQDTPVLMKETFLSAAHEFLECEVPSKAGMCLEYAKELPLAAKLYEKINMLEKAAEIYKKIHLPIDGSRCLEEACKFRQAISLLCESKLYDAAIHCRQRYQLLKRGFELKDEPLPERLTENAPYPYQSEVQLNFDAADTYHKQGQVQKMMSCLDQLPNLEDKIDFLAHRDRTDEAISLLKMSGTPLPLFEFYMRHGLTDEALKVAENMGDGTLRNRCIILDSIIKLSEVNEDTVTDESMKTEIGKRLNTVFYVMQDSKDKVLAGRVALMYGKLKKEREFVKKAFGAFSHAEPDPSLAGQLQCMDWMTFNTNLFEYSNIAKCVLGIKTLFKALTIIIRPINDSERQQLSDMLEYYGFHGSFGDKTFLVYPRQRPMALDIIQSPKIEKSKHVCKVHFKKIKANLLQFLIQKGIKWYAKLECTLESSRTNLFKELEKYPPKKVFVNVIENGLRAVELEMYIRMGCREFHKRKEDLKTDLGSLERISFEKCERLFRDMYPDNGVLVTEQMISGSRTIRNRFHQSLTEYCQNLVSTNRVDWKENHVHRFTNFIFLYDILHVRMCDRPEKVIKEVEESLQNEMRLTFVDSVAEMEKIENFGFEITRKQSGRKGELLTRSICNQLIASQMSLKNQNPIEALLRFGQFCHALSLRNSDVLSNISHLLYWMEFYLTISLLSITVLLSTPKDKEHRVSLPESYFENAIAFNIAMSNENCLMQKITNKRSIPKENEVELLEIPACFSKLLCGSSCKGCLLDFISKNHDNRMTRAQNNAFSERLLVLGLVIFCNLRNKISCASDIETELANKLCSLKVHRNMPCGVKKALETLQNTETPLPGNFQTALRELISLRRNDSVKTYREGNEGFCGTAFNSECDRKNAFLCPQTNNIIRHPRVHHKSKVRNSPEVSENNLKSSGTRIILNQNNDKHCPSTPKEKNLEKAFEVFANDLMDGRDTDQHTDNTPSCTYDTKRGCNESREERARYIIIRFLRHVAFRKRVAQMRTDLKERIFREKTDQIEKLFRCSKIDSSICEVCGTPVSMTAAESTSGVDGILYEKETNGEHDSSETNLELKKSNEKGNKVSEESDLNKKIPENPFLLLLQEGSKSAYESPENIDQHNKSETHQKNVKKYDMFKSKFRDEIFDTMVEIERFIEIYDLREGKTHENYKAMSFYIDTLCKDSGQLWKSVHKTIYTKDWGNSVIQEKIESLCHTFNVVRDPVRRIAKETKKEKQMSGSGTVQNDKGDGDIPKQNKKRKFKALQKFTFRS